MTVGVLRLLGSMLAAGGLLALGLLLTPRVRPPALARLDAEGNLPGEPIPRRVSLDAFLANFSHDALRTRLDRLRESLNAKTRSGGPMAAKLMLAGVKVTPTEWRLLVLGVSMVLGLLALLRFQALQALPFGMVLGYLAPQAALKIMSGRRRRAMDKQLVPLLQAVNSRARAGIPITAAFDQAGTASTPPIRSELLRVSREVHLGIPLPVAMTTLVERTHLDELNLLVTALEIHAQVGGNLVEVLDGIELTMRERVRIKGEIRTLTSQARASGWVLGLLPIILGFLLFVIAPTYFRPMLSSSLGIGMLLAAGFLLTIGCIFIQKLAKVDY